MQGGERLFYHLNGRSKKKREDIYLIAAMGIHCFQIIGYPNRVLIRFSYF